MNLPTEIKWGWKTILIEYNDTLLQHRHLLASAYSTTSVIQIEASMSIMGKHKQIVDGVWRKIMGLCIPEYDDEDHIAIGHVIYATLRENPKLCCLEKPSFVKVLGISWAVVLEQATGNYDAHMDTAKQTIYISDIVEEQIFHHFLWHEICHIIFSALSLEFEDKTQNEKNMDLLSWHMLQLLNDNDFSWIYEGVDNEKPA